MIDFLRSLWRGFPAQIITFAILPLSIFVILVAVGSFVLHQSAMLDMVRSMDERTTTMASQRLNDEISERIRFLQAVDTRPEQIEPSLGMLLSDQFPLGWRLIRDDGLEESRQSNRIDWQDSNIQHWLANNNPSSGEISVSPPIPLSDHGIVVILANRKDVGLLLAAFDPVSTVFRPLQESNLLPENGSPVLLINSPDTEPVFLQWEDGETQPIDAGEVEYWERLIAEPSQDYIVSSHAVSSVGWQITFIEPWQAINDPLLEATEYAPLLFVPILLAALASIWFGMKKIVIPIRQLAVMATDVSQGNYEALGSDVDAIVEIQQLQSELNRMARQVKEAQDSLRDYVDAVTVGQEEERKRLAREIHDSTIQALIALNQRIQLLQLKLNGQMQDGEIEQLEEMATEIIADLRRLTGALRPIYLEELGLVAALQMLATETEETTGLRVACEISGQPFRLSGKAELTVFRIAQEALRNCVKHAEATEAHVHLFFASVTVSLQVADNGQGFIMPERPMVFTHNRHFGIVGMIERAELIGASLHIRTKPGRGTVVELEMRQAEPTAA